MSWFPETSGVKALFVTTPSNDCDNHVAAWESFNDPATRAIFDPRDAPRDDQILGCARSERPHVIFYIGAVSGCGLPAATTFRALRDIAPTVNLCSDAADPPWHPVLADYKRNECFDLQVGIDGCDDAPVDLVTLTPVDPRPFAGPASDRDILCGFSGTVGLNGVRAHAVARLKMANVLTLRRRVQSASYAEHVAFLRRCKSVVNVSMTGSQRLHHVKGRVLEAGWAGCALFEMGASPTKRFFPPRCFLAYTQVQEIPAMLADQSRLTESAAELAAAVRAHHTPAQIYGRILERLGVAAAKPLAAA
jgi:hypothetical protein